MKIYNSLTKQLEEIEPMQPGKVGLYSCGPTVYNNLHIGNLAAFIYADLLRRTLAQKLAVNAVMNITDVDDKTIRDSRRDHPDLNPKQALTKLTQKYEKIFLDDTARIGNDTSALHFIRATDSIEEMISLTQKLLDNNIAYIAEDGVYFSIQEYEKAGYTYGVLQTIDRSHEHARIANDEYDKDHVSDFALWKRAENGEPSWDATFTHDSKQTTIPGRPGWHIECSAMSQKLLGIPFDIHTGGIDLKFPHHENEIAQARGALRTNSFANYFVHNNHVLIDGKKMSKSLGNFFTLRDIEDKGFDPIAFRLLVLSSHYRSESNFSWDILQAAQMRLAHWQYCADLRFQTIAYNKDQHPVQELDLKTYQANLAECLEDDLDSPRALIAAYSGLEQAKLRGVDNNTRDAYTEYIEFIKNRLGIDLMKTSDISDDQKKLVSERQKARDNKDWQKSDQLRDALQSQGIGIDDTEHGQIWYRV